MYLLFMGNDYYPQGGWYDFKLAGKTIEDVLPKSRVTREWTGNDGKTHQQVVYWIGDDDAETFEWFQVVDTRTKKEVKVVEKVVDLATK